MTLRELPTSEYGRLAGSDLAHLVTTLEPSRCTVLVVEEQGEIVGQWALVWLPHLEGVELKRPSAARRLLAGMRALLRREGIRTAFTGACSPDVMHILDRLGAQRVPYTPYAWTPEGE